MTIRDALSRFKAEMIKINGRDIPFNNKILSTGNLSYQQKAQQSLVNFAKYFADILGEPDSTTLGMVARGLRNKPNITNCFKHLDAKTKVLQIIDDITYQLGFASADFLKEILITDLGPGDGFKGNLSKSRKTLLANLARYEQAQAQSITSALRQRNQALLSWQHESTEIRNITELSSQMNEWVTKELQSSDSEQEQVLKQVALAQKQIRHIQETINSFASFNTQWRESCIQLQLPESVITSVYTRTLADRNATAEAKQNAWDGLYNTSIKKEIRPDIQKEDINSQLLQKYQEGEKLISDAGLIIKQLEEQIKQLEFRRQASLALRAYEVQLNASVTHHSIDLPLPEGVSRAQDGSLSYEIKVPDADKQQLDTENDQNIITLFIKNLEGFIQQLSELEKILITQHDTFNADNPLPNHTSMAYQQAFLKARSTASRHLQERIALVTQQRLLVEALCDQASSELTSIADEGKNPILLAIDERIQAASLAIEKSEANLQASLVAVEKPPVNEGPSQPIAEPILTQPPKESVLNIFKKLFKIKQKTMPDPVIESIAVTISEPLKNTEEEKQEEIFLKQQQVRFDVINYSQALLLRRISEWEIRFSQIEPSLLLLNTLLTDIKTLDPQQALQAMEAQQKVFQKLVKWLETKPSFRQKSGKGIYDQVHESLATTATQWGELVNFESVNYPTLSIESIQRIVEAKNDGKRTLQKEYVQLMSRSDAIDNQCRSLEEMIKDFTTTQTNLTIAVQILQLNDMDEHCKALNLVIATELNTMGSDEKTALLAKINSTLSKLSPLATLTTFDNAQLIEKIAAVQAHLPTLAATANTLQSELTAAAETADESAVAVAVAVPHVLDDEMLNLKKEFAQLLLSIANKKKAFAKSGHIEAERAAQKLYLGLLSASNDYFSGKVDYQSFRYSCREAIHTARDVLQHHRHWVNFIATVALGLVSLGLIPTAIACYSKIKTGHFHVRLFDTNSTKTLDAIEDKVGQMSFAAG